MATCFSAWQAFLAQAAPAAQPSPYSTILLVGFMGLMFYFIILRPAGKERKRREGMLEALRNGDQVVTSAGMMGVVAGIEDDTVYLKVADNVKIKFQKSAIQSVVSPEEKA